MLVVPPQAPFRRSPVSKTKFLRRLRLRGAVALGIAATAIAALPAAAVAESPTSTPASECGPQSFTQPFLSAGDQNSYTLMYGQSADTFDGSGWTLSGGASIVTT